MIENKKKLEIAVHAEWVGFMLSCPCTTYMSRGLWCTKPWESIT